MKPKLSMSSPTIANENVGGSFRQAALLRLIKIWKRRLIVFNRVYYKKYYRRKPSKDYCTNFHQFIIILGKQKATAKNQRIQKTATWITQFIQVI